MAHGRFCQCIAGFFIERWTVDSRGPLRFVRVPAKTIDPATHGGVHGANGGTVQDAVLAGDPEVRKQGILRRVQRERDPGRRRAVDDQGVWTIDQRRGSHSTNFLRRKGEGRGAGDAEPNGDAVSRQGRGRLQSKEARELRGCDGGPAREGIAALESGRPSRSPSRKRPGRRPWIEPGARAAREGPAVPRHERARPRPGGSEHGRGDRRRPSGHGRVSVARFTLSRVARGRQRDHQPGKTCFFRTELAREKEEAEKMVRATGSSLVSAGLPVEERAARASTESKPLPPLSGGENPRLPGASALLEIEETATAGKRAVACKRIDPGDALVVEPPLASALLPEFFGTHCHHCFARFRAPVGCPACSSVAFCGRRCRDAAITSYHRYECKILALLIGSGMSVLSVLAFRMVTRSGPTECRRIWRALTRRDSPATEQQPSAETRVPAGPSKSAKRRARKKTLRDSMRAQNGATTEGDLDLRAYDLVAHESKRSAKDFFQRSLMAAFLLKCLQRVGFFEKPARDDEFPAEEEIAVGALLLKHLQLLQFNAHEVFETRHGAVHRFRGSRPVYLGVAIYPTVARFNHDCYPAVSRYFVGRCIVIRATRTLRPGDVVAENYGPIFTKRSLPERQRTLAGRYWFRCECTACREDWPRFETLTNDHVRLRCPTDGCSKLHRRPRHPRKPVECPSCRREVDLGVPLRSLLECEQDYARGFAAMEAEQPLEASTVFFEATSKFHRVAAAPHKDTHLTEIAVAACMADQGNVAPPSGSGDHAMHPAKE